MKSLGSTPTAETGKRKFETVSKSGLGHKATALGHERFSEYVSRYPQIQVLQEQLEDQFPGQVNFHLPRLDALSGNILLHCSFFLDNLIEVQGPVMFKVGFTHNPVWRWGSPIYGYASGAKKEKYSNMSVIYAAPEPYSPAMLEAALIDKYKRLLAQLIINLSLFFLCTIVYPIDLWVPKSRLC